MVPILVKVKVEFPCVPHLRPLVVQRGVPGEGDVTCVAAVGFVNTEGGTSLMRPREKWTQILLSVREECRGYLASEAEV